MPYLNSCLLFFRYFLIACLFFGCPALVRSQHCLNLFELPKNAKYEYQLLDKRNKQIGMVKNMVLSLQTDTAETILILKSGVYNPKNKLKHSADYTLHCRNDRVYYDKMLLLDHDNLKSFKGKQMTFEGQDLIWPLAPESGQALPEGNLLVKIIIFNKTAAEINHRVYDRQVLETEEIETPAGTFLCHRISFKYEVVTHAIGLNITSRDYGTAYFSPRHGLIKTQFESKDGKRKLNSIVLRSKSNLP